MSFAQTLPDGGSAYVVAAFLVFLALLLIYLAIMGVRVARMERDLIELDDLVRERNAASDPDEQPEQVTVP